MTRDEIGQTLVQRLRDTTGRHISGLYDIEAADEIERLTAGWNEAFQLALQHQIRADAMGAALVALHCICRDCDLDHDAERPTEEQYTEAMDAADIALADERNGT